MPSGFFSGGDEAGRRDAALSGSCVGSVVGTPTPALCGTTLAWVARLFPVLPSFTSGNKGWVSFFSFCLQAFTAPLCHISLARILCQGEGPCSWFLPFVERDLKWKPPECWRLKDLGEVGGQGGLESTLPAWGLQERDFQPLLSLTQLMSIALDQAL